MKTRRQSPGMLRNPCCTSTKVRGLGLFLPWNFLIYRCEFNSPMALKTSPVRMTLAQHTIHQVIGEKNWKTSAEEFSKEVENLKLPEFQRE